MTFRYTALVGVFTNPSEKYKLVKLDNFPNFQGENQKKIWVATT